jgi:hypothetical protein
MDAFLFRCPRTGQTVQGFAADQATERDAMVQVVCHACGSVHFVSPKQEAERDGEPGALHNPPRSPRPRH